MKSASLLLVPFTLLLLSACGGSGSGGDDAPVVPVTPSKAVLTVSPASIELFAQSATPATLTVTNTSTSITATSISALLPAGWTDVIQDASGCASLPPQAHCTLSFTPGDASHPQASVNISGHNTETASAVVVVSPFNGAVIAPLTATEVVLEVGQTLTMAFVNNSATVTAANIRARLDGTALAGNVTQVASACAAVLPGAVCNLTISAGSTSVSPTSFSIRGDNTSTIGGSIAITQATSAQLAITGSPLVLQATAGTATAGVVTVTNLSTDVVATNISADFTNTALVGKVTQDASACTTLLPQASCTLTFTPLSTEVAQTAFTIRGDNTSQIGASIAIDAPQAALSVTGSPLTLFVGGVPASVVVTNISEDTANDIASNFTGTALDGKVTETSTPCAVLAPHQSCMLTVTLTGGATAPSTSFAIAGSNTNTVTAEMTIRTLEVGDTFGGGIVLVLPAGGSPGLIVSTSETSLEWGGAGDVTNAQDLNDGAANTTTIVTALGANNGTPYAAASCDELSESVGTVTYDDWFLPSRNQLTALITSDFLSSLGIFSNNYWSSSEVNAANATIMTSFVVRANVDKTSLYLVRCARTFTL